MTSFWCGSVYSSNSPLCSRTGLRSDYKQSSSSAKWLEAVVKSQSKPSKCPSPWKAAKIRDANPPHPSVSLAKVRPNFVSYLFLLGWTSGCEQYYTGKCCGHCKTSDDTRRVGVATRDVYYRSFGTPSSLWANIHPKHEEILKKCHNLWWLL